MNCHEITKRYGVPLPIVRLLIRTKKYNFPIMVGKEFGGKHCYDDEQVKNWFNENNFTKIVFSRAERGVKSTPNKQRKLKVEPISFLNIPIGIKR